MGKTLAYKILEKNKQSGILQQGEELTVRVNQTLTQDSTGTMVYLQMEAMGIDSIKTDRSVAYIDHNTLQAGFENADDHQFIQSAAAKYGIVFSKPGNGICHQLHLERFGKPGEVLIGSDSHTPTGGGLGMLAIGSGGLDVAVAMAKGTYNMKAPKVYEVHLTGQLPAWVSAKDVILEVLRNLSVKGGVGYIIEYTGPGGKIFIGYRPGDDYQYGCRIGCNHIHLPVRRANPGLFDPSRPRRRLSAPFSRRRCRLRFTSGNRLVHLGSHGGKAP